MLLPRNLRASHESCISAGVAARTLRSRRTLVVDGAGPLSALFVTARGRAPALLAAGFETSVERAGGAGTRRIVPGRAPVEVQARIAAGERTEVTLDLEK